MNRTTVGKGAGSELGCGTMGTHLRWGIAFFAICASYLMTADTLLAAPTPVTIDDRSPALENGDNGAKTAALGLTNLTDGPIALSVQLDVPQPGCDLTLDKMQLPTAEHSAVKVNIPAACDTTHGPPMTLTASAPSQTPVTFPVTPTPGAAAKPDWKQLWAFVAALASASVLVSVIYRRWRGIGSKRNPERKLSQPLGTLDATWSFNDTWVTNITAAGALLTGIFGSADVAKAFLGPDADSSIALATVGAAIALAFIAAGPIILQSCRSYEQDDTTNPNGDAFTVGGLLFAGAVTLTGALGQLWVGMSTGEDFNLGGWQHWLWLPFALALVLLVIYTWRNLPDLLTQGTTPAQKVESDAIAAAKLIVEALKAHPEIDDEKVQRVLDESARKYPEGPTSPGDTGRPRRSALL